MKKILTALVMFTFLPLGTPAAAEPMNSTPTPAQLESACGKNGGSYWGNLVTYGCTKKNCDGKGGTCQVICKHGGSCKGLNSEAGERFSEPRSWVAPVA